MQHHINEKIRSNMVRIIEAPAGFNKTMTLKEALEIAKELKTDLVEVANQGSISVCRLIDYGKLKFQMQKKSHKDKLNQKVAATKEVQLSLNIGKHDLETKLHQSVAFLHQGSRVKFIIRFRGREMFYKSTGVRLLDSLESKLSEVGAIEFLRKEEDRSIIATAFLKQPKHQNSLDDKNK